MYRLCFLFFCFSLALASCIKWDDPQPSNGVKPTQPAPETMPPATQEGKNTFGLYLDGKLWVPRKEKSNLTSTTLTASYYRGDLSITATREDATNNLIQDFGIVFENQDLADTGLYILRNRYYCGAFFWQSQDSCGEFTTQDTITGQPRAIPSKLYRGTLHITKFDKEKRILSGEFDATLGSPKCGMHKISQGRFDVKY